MRLRVLTEAGRASGLGHYLRCSSLAAAAQERGHAVSFGLHDPDGLHVPNADWLVERFPMLWTADAVARLTAESDVVIVDSYLAPFEIYEGVAAQSSQCLWLDDCARLAYPAGYILNANRLASAEDYPGFDRAHLLLGSEWQPLRAAFWDVKPSEIQDTVHNCFVCFGGTDPRGMVKQLLPALLDAFGDWTFVVVAGNSVDVPECLAGPRVKVFRDADDQTVANLMLNADVAVSAAGQTSYELARCGVPSVLVLVAENQRANLDAAVGAGYCLNAIRWTEEDLTEAVVRDLKALGTEKRRAMRAAGTHSVDGQGARRVVSLLMDAHDA